MSLAATRWTAVLLAALMLNACAGLQQINIPVTGDARAFTEGLDQYRIKGDPAALKALPPGEWQDRAGYILALGTQKQRLQTQLKGLKEQLKTKDQELAVQQQEIQKLESTLNQLKEVLIDTELQPK